MKLQQFLNGSNPALHRMTLDENVISSRLSKRLTLLEVAGFGLGVAVCLITLSGYRSGAGGLIDFRNYLNFADGDSSNFFYAYWLKPIFICFLPY